MNDIKTSATAFQKREIGNFVCNHSYLQRLTYLKIESLELRRIYLDLAMVHKSIGEGRTKWAP